MSDFTLFKKIREQYTNLTPGEKKAADYMMGDYQTAAFLSCMKFGEAAGVSDTTVVRLSNSLGFPGYTAMKNALQEIVRQEISPKEKLSKTISNVESQSYIHQIYELEKTNLETTFEKLDQAEFQKVMDKVCSARKIFIMGLGVSSATVRYLAYRLRRVRKDVMDITDAAYSLVEKISLLSEEDVFIAFDFPRYANDVFKTIRYAKEEIKTYTVLITDNWLNSALEYADSHIMAASETLGFTNSIISSDYIANLISIGAILREKDKSVTQLEKNEQFAKILGHSI